MRLLLLALLLISPVVPAAASDPVAFSAQKGEVFSFNTASPELKARVEKRREVVIMLGHRFDESAGTILSSKTKAPLTLKEVEEILAEIDKAKTFDVLERMSAILSKQDLSKPLSPSVLAQLETLAGTQKNGIPPGLLKLLDGTSKVSAKILVADVENAYMESTRYFDGQEVAGKTSVLGSHTSGPQYFDDAEKKLGLKLQAAVAAHLAKNPVGAELLKKFAGKDGKLALPAMMVLKLNPEYGAFYSSYNQAFVVNSVHILDLVAARAPPQERDALKKELSDPKKLAAHLLVAPKALEAFVADNDETIVHELIHAVQYRRGEIDQLMTAGPVPSVFILEREHEAFLESNRYLHQKLLADPSAAAKSTHFSGYMAMIQDFERWRDGISQSYLETWPDAAANLKTVEDLRQTRLAAADKLKLKNVLNTAWFDFESLKTKRIKNAGADLKSGEKTHNKYISKFLAEEYPKMRYEGYLARAKILVSEGRPYDAFNAYRWAADLAAAAKLDRDVRRKTAFLVHDAAVAARDWLKGAGAERPAAEREAVRDGLEKWAKMSGMPASWVDQ